jgi:phosphate transport system substrate-binding protein
METWSANYAKQTGVKIEYSAVGSPRGVDGLISNFLDFSCTEAALTDEQMAEAGSEIIHIPLAMGAVAVAYNVSDANGQPLSLRFTSAILSNIYLGKIKNWNDPAIALSNPGRELPDLPITVIFRKDGSGTTAIWTEYLSKTNSTWKNQIGSGTRISWPVGVGTERNHGIADAVNRTTGSIGYVELSYATANGLSVSPVMNQSGNYVAPSVDGIMAAAASLKSIPADLRFSLVDTSGANVYPIVGTSWVILRKDQPNQRGTALVQFLKWIVTEGQSQLASQQYGRLPSDLADRASQSLNKIVVAN